MTNSEILAAYYGRNPDNTAVVQVPGHNGWYAVSNPGDPSSLNIYYDSVSGHFYPFIEGVTEGLPGSSTWAISGATSGNNNPTTPTTPAINIPGGGSGGGTGGGSGGGSGGGGSGGSGRDWSWAGNAAGFLSQPLAYGPYATLFDQANDALQLGHNMSVVGPYGRYAAAQAVNSNYYHGGTVDHVGNSGEGIWNAPNPGGGGGGGGGSGGGGGGTVGGGGTNPIHSGAVDPNNPPSTNFGGSNPNFNLNQPSLNTGLLGGTNAISPSNVFDPSHPPSTNVGSFGNFNFNQPSLNFGNGSGSGNGGGAPGGGVTLPIRDYPLSQSQTPQPQFQYQNSTAPASQGLLGQAQAYRNDPTALANFARLAGNQSLLLDPTFQNMLGGADSWRTNYNSLLGNNGTGGTWWMTHPFARNAQGNWVPQGWTPGGGNGST